MTPTITWRPATADDVGRLARFRDEDDIGWDYGMLSRVFVDVATPKKLHWEFNHLHLFEICEVQEVTYG